MGSRFLDFRHRWSKRLLPSRWRRLGWLFWYRFGYWLYFAHSFRRTTRKLEPIVIFIISCDPVSASTPLPLVIPTRPRAESNIRTRPASRDVPNAPSSPGLTLFLAALAAFFAVPFASVFALFTVGASSSSNAILALLRRAVARFVAIDSGSKGDRARTAVMSSVVM